VDLKPANFTQAFSLGSISREQLGNMTATLLYGVFHARKFRRLGSKSIGSLNLSRYAHLVVGDKASGKCICSVVRPIERG